MNILIESILPATAFALLLNLLRLVFLIIDGDESVIGIFS